MKRLLTGCLAATVAFGAVPAKAEFSANAAIVSDYMFYGFSQSLEGWAVQGGFDWTHEETGFYLGGWASSVDFGSGASNPATIELDAFFGIGGEFSGGLSWDVGAWFYNYPNQNEDVGGDYDYFELYANFGYTFAGTLEPTLSAGIYVSPDFFGEAGTSYYPSVQLDFALPEDFGVYGKIGYLDVDDIDLSYFHYKFGITKSLLGLDFDVSYNGAESECDAGLGRSFCEAVVFAVSKSF